MSTNPCTICSDDEYATSDLYTRGDDDTMSTSSVKEIDEFTPEERYNIVKLIFVWSTRPFSARYHIYQATNVDVPVTTRLPEDLSEHTSSPYLLKHIADDPNFIPDYEIMELSWDNLREKYKPTFEASGIQARIKKYYDDLD